MSSKPKKYCCTSGISLGEVVILEITDRSLREHIARAKNTKSAAIADFIAIMLRYLESAYHLLDEELAGHTSIGISATEFDSDPESDEACEISAYEMDHTITIEHVTPQTTWAKRGLAPTQKEKTDE